MTKRHEKAAYDKLKSVHPRAHWQRVESWTGVGIPDTNACQDGVELWVENKECQRPKTSRGHVKPRFRPEQIAWITSRCLHGGRVFVAIAMDKQVFLVKIDERAERLRELRDGVSYDRLVEMSFIIENMFKKEVQ